MFYKTIDEYNDELKKMEDELEETHEYLKKHPEKLGTKGNYETMKYLYKVFKNDKNEFIKNMNDFELKLKGNSLNSPLTINNTNILNKKFNETTNSTTNLFEGISNSNEELYIKSIGQGSYTITYAFQNPHRRRC